jgi:hypothetical protein
LNPSLLNHASTLKDITDVLIELILWTAIPEKYVQNIDTGNYIKKEIVLETIDLSKLPTTYFLTFLNLYIRWKKYFSLLISR